MDSAELKVLERLDTLLRVLRVRDSIDRIVTRVQADLDDHPDADMAWEPVPLPIYGDQLPAEIRSSWVFILRTHTHTGAERHPNSHQRIVAYAGDGDFQTRLDGPWQSNHLTSRLNAPIPDRWVSIPPFVWHQSAGPEQDWVVVSFHTVEAEDLIEERPGTAESGGVRQMKYLN